MKIGIWKQPAMNVAQVSKWAKRGITHFIMGDNPEQNQSRVDFAALVSGAGMRWMMGASADPVSDSQLPGFDGFTQFDEADLANHLVKLATGVSDLPATIKRFVDNYARLKAAVPSATVFANFAGPVLTSARTAGIPTQPVDVPFYTAIFKGADICSADWYLTNTSRAVEGYLRVTIGAQIDRILQLASGPLGAAVPKSAWACIECSNQNLSTSSREPTPAEFRAMVYMAIVHGAQGIWYFPQKIGGGFIYDAMTDALAGTMASTNAELQRLDGYFRQGAARTFKVDGTSDVATWTLPTGTLIIQVNTLPLGVTITEQPATTTTTPAPPPIPVPDPLKAMQLQIDGLAARLTAIEKAPKITGVELKYTFPQS